MNIASDRSRAFSIALLFAFCACAACSDACAQEQITIATYYPSPFGLYMELRARRTALGNSYSDNQLHPFDTTGIPGPSEIPQEVDLAVEADLGIGTYQPQARLHVDTRGSSADPGVLLDLQDSSDSVYKSGIDFARAGTRGAFLGITGEGAHIQSLNIDISDTPQTDVTIAAQGNMAIGGFAGTGDTNGDGHLTNMDALIIINSLSTGTQLSPEMRRRADVTLDGAITGEDATRIVQYVNDGYDYPIDNQTAPNGKTAGNLQAYDVYVRNAGKWASELGGGAGVLAFSASGQPLAQISKPTILAGTVTISKSIASADVPLRISWNNTPFKRIQAVILNGPSLGFPLLASELNAAPAAKIQNNSSFDLYWNPRSLQFVPSYDFYFLVIGEGK